MIPFFICLGGFAIVFLMGQMGTRLGGYLALSGMLSTILGTWAGLRYWFLVSRALGEHGGTPSPVHFVIVYWALFFVTVYVAAKIRQNYTEVFESTFPSIVDRGLGGAFGAASGIVIMASLMMTLSVASPQIWPGYRHDQLPLPVDRWPLVAYRFIETRVAGIGPKEAGHTLLPTLSETEAKSPEEFWR